MIPENIGIALSHAERSENIEPRSSLGTNFDVIDRRAGATIGPKLAIQAPKYIIHPSVAMAKQTLPNECAQAPIATIIVSFHLRTRLKIGTAINITRTKEADWNVLKLL